MADVKSINYKPLSRPSKHTARFKKSSPVCFSTSTAVSPAQDAAESKMHRFIEASAVGGRACDLMMSSTGRVESTGCVTSGRRWHRRIPSLFHRFGAIIFHVGRRMLVGRHRSALRQPETDSRSSAINLVFRATNRGANEMLGSPPRRCDGVPVYGRRRPSGPDPNRLKYS